MSFSDPFIKRPVGTTLLTAAIALAGMLGYMLLPVSPLPQVEFPTVSVNSSLPGASPETMASSVATPLERQFGRIAGVTEMTSNSGLGSAGITLQFDLNRNIDAAARDVQAAINAARGQLPANLPNNPTYRKVNPADAPILILALTSDTYDRGKMYDAASSILQQKLSQVRGVGQVQVGGGALPAVRVELNPALIQYLGLSLDDVRNALSGANANRPKGSLADGSKFWSITATDQLRGAAAYRPLIIAYRNGAPISLSEVATVTDSVEDVRTGGSSNGKPAVLMIISRQPGANIIETVDSVKELIPRFQAELPAGIRLSVAMDRTTTIRASVHDVEITLLISIILVVLVVFLFLRDWRSTLIPTVAVPISLVGTFGIMYLLGYSLDNLSLMALTIATGFVVDDAIVVIENISRHREAGMSPMDAAVLGAREIGFTVTSISISLVAVFIPILLMGGIVGRLFREFAVTLSAAIAVSLVVSLTTTPMMCAYLLKDETRKRGTWHDKSEQMFDRVRSSYERGLQWVLRHQLFTLIVTLATIVLTIVLYVEVPKGFFPQQDTGRIMGNIQADQDTSFQAMHRLVDSFSSAVSEDPAVESVTAFVGGGGGGGRMFVTLKSLGERKLSADQIIARIRQRVSKIPGGVLLMQSVQDLRVGGRSSGAQYQYTLQGDSLQELVTWAPKLLAKMRTLQGLADVNSDQQNKGLQAVVEIDRASAARYGITPQQIDDALYDSFGQRQVSVIYNTLNQYHVVMEVDPAFSRTPEALNLVRVPSSNGTQVPLGSIAHFVNTVAPLSVTHQGQFPAITLSFNLQPGYSIGDAVSLVEQAERDMEMPVTIHGSFQGTAQAFQSSLQSEPILVLAALATVYIVLGVLYESYIHPITILSTLPSAGVGAIIALIITGLDLSVIALIGIILLIGIVKKNAIMMIDFAMGAERGGKSPEEAIFEACVLRFRPIMMTTMAALFGGLPLALGLGVGAELRQPLGIAVVGGLVFSQALTLFTTPVVYLYLDRARLRVRSWRRPAPLREALP